MAEEEALKDDIFHPNTLIAWERIHLPSLPTQIHSQSPTISLPDPHLVESTWSTPPSTTVVFPPNNHEGLNLHHQCDVPETYVEPAKPSVSVSTEPKPKPVVIGGPIGIKWWFLRFKLKDVVSCIWKCVVSRRGLFRLLDFPMIGTVVVVLFYLRFRRRRRRRLRGEAIDELLGVIKEKDERIQQLLHQIARMNELLLASHHGVPMISKATSS